MSGFPTVRMRRLRKSPALRRLVQETRLDPAQLVWPLFFAQSGREPEPVAGMPGVFRHPVSAAARLAHRAIDLRLGGVLVFGIPDRKDEVGSSAYDDTGVVQQAVNALKEEGSDLVVVADTCLCAYTDHGHCGVVRDGTVDNDASLELLARTAVSQARAGADMVAPSDMMDGRVAAIRSALDREGFGDTPVMSYAAKHASAFYGPFRQAADSAPQTGDRRGYQLDPANGDEALREIALDLEEGADIVMVKPGLPCLDIIRNAKERFGAPLAAYQVSGEYSSIKLAGEAGALDPEAAMLESLLALRRAGADIIITYAAVEVAERLR